LGWEDFGNLVYKKQLDFSGNMDGGFYFFACSEFATQGGGGGNITIVCCVRQHYTYGFSDEPDFNNLLSV